METLKKILEKFKKFWYWFSSWFITYYEIKVSYNHTWGDADDQTYVVKKIYKKQLKTALKAQNHPESSNWMFVL